jgi:hypothetical protein
MVTAHAIPLRCELSARCLNFYHEQVKTRRRKRTLKLEQEGYITSEWGISDNNRKAKYYKLTRAGRKRLAQETQKWETTTEILARFFAPLEES